MDKTFWKRKRKNGRSQACEPVIVDILVVGHYRSRHKQPKNLLTPFGNAGDFLGACPASIEEHKPARRIIDNRMVLVFGFVIFYKNVLGRMKSDRST